MFKMVPRQLQIRRKSSKSSSFIMFFTSQAGPSPGDVQAGWKAKIFKIVELYNVVCRPKPAPETLQNDPKRAQLQSRIALVPERYQNVSK
jgi:hypothetical protein